MDLMEFVSSESSASRHALWGEAQQPVVIKVLEVHKVESWKALELFEREARVLRSLSHPGIPRYLEAGPVENAGTPTFQLVQEHIEGRDLQVLLDEAAARGTTLFDEADARRFLRSMLEILGYLHSVNPPVMHRNIKPSKIIARGDGTYALVDFGSVQAVLPQTMTGSTFVGTTGYMAPEQMMGRAVPASDIFSLGATTIHLLSGVHPGNLPVRRMTLDFSRVVDVSDELQRILRKMVAPKVEDRYASPAEILEVLGEEEEVEQDIALSSSTRRVVQFERPGHHRMQGRKEDGKLELYFPPRFNLEVILLQVFLTAFFTVALMVLPDALKALVVIGGVYAAYRLIPRTIRTPTLILDREELRFESRSGGKGKVLFRLPARNLQFEEVFGEEILHSRRPSTFVFRTPQEEYALPVGITHEESRWISGLIEVQLEENRRKSR